ncbi:MAG: hypothetical protein KKG76_14270 [Euryarchaeota archaeon]|nr:hypothetical protein [Euryarchaeota archaeon]
MIRIAVFLLTLSLALTITTSSGISLNQVDIPNISINNITKNNIISWYPQVIEYLYVNETKVEAVEYSITFHEQIAESRWTLDGHSVDGSNDNNKYYYLHTWDEASRGFHKVTYEGITAGHKTEFKWYVNVYEIGGDGDGSIFEVISDMLENHAVELKLRRFRDQLSNNDDQVEFGAQNVRWLHDEISERQITREVLDLDFRNGNLTFEEYVASRKEVQVETRYYMKLAQEMAGIIRNEFNNQELGREFENFSFTEEDWAWSEQVNEKIRERQSITKIDTNKYNNKSDPEKD